LPATTKRIRVRILHELYEGRDRSYADVEAIRVLDRSGRNRARATVQPVRVSGALEGELPPSALAVTPTTAEVLARFDHPDHPPALLRNKFGQGQALLVTCPVVPRDGPFWTGLGQLAWGEPAFAVSADDCDRFRFILAHVGDAHVLHVIDAAVPAKDYQPKSVAVSLAARHLGARRQATLVGSDQALTLVDKGGRLHFTVQPSPVATVVLTGAE
jgi:hypothetical protein